MNRSRALVFVLAAFASVLLFLSACSNGDDDDNASSGPPAINLDDDLGDDTAAGDDAGDDSMGDDTLPEVLDIAAGEMTVRVRTDPYMMTVLGPDGQTLLETPEPDKSINLSPMPFLPHGFQIGDWEDDWGYARKVTAKESVAGETVLRIQAADAKTGEPKGEIVLSIKSENDRHLVITTTIEGVARAENQTGCWKLEPDEHFFGLGWQKDAIDQRGKVRTMYLGLGVDLTDQIQNHAPMPFYISSRGYGLFVEEKGKGYFDMGRGKPNAYGYKYHTDTLKTHVFWGPDPLDVIEGYTGITGRPPMNPDYLFGHLHWRNVNDSEDEVYSDADALRAHGIPTSSIMVDAPWESAYSTFRFNECDGECVFHDAQAMINYVHQKGYAFYLWTAEFVNSVSPVEQPGMIEDNSEEFNYAKSHGYLLPLLGVIYEIPWWHDTGAMVNFLNPDAFDWYKGLASNVMQMGAQGFKMDGGEYPGADTLGTHALGVFGTQGYGNTNTLSWDYKWAYHQLFWEVAHEYNDNLAISTVRCAVWGEQVHVNYFWPGDLESNWGTALGLPADIIGGLNLGTAGFPYYGSNDGGFSDFGYDDPLLLSRWTEYSAFRPIFESPRGGAQEVWEAFPPPMEDIYRKYAVIHTRLFPYMKAYALKATQTGHPIMRMMPVAFPGDERTYTDNFDYMLGEWLLVAPVYINGAFTRDVYLPAGRWVDYWTGEAHDGPADITVDAPEDVIPVFARAGAIIPMLDASVQTLWPTDDPDVVDHEDAADLLWADIYPSGNSAFTMADGTSFALAQTGGGFTMTMTGAPLTRTYSLRAVPAAYGGGEPASVSGPSGDLPRFDTYDAWVASVAGWFYDAALGNLWVRDRGLNPVFTVSP